MPTPADFLEVTKYAGAATLVLAAITVLAFVLGWGFRFRLVGITSFMGVLAAGLFGLSFQPFTQTVIPGSVPYQTVYDSGGSPDCDYGAPVRHSLRAGSNTATGRHQLT
jgi:uncharacterized membrane protein